MANILYMAISKDGYIAGPNNETPWSDEEWESFKSFLKSCDAVLLGRNTFEVMKRENEYIDGPEYYVATSDSGIDIGDFHRIQINSLGDLPQASKLGIIGGGDLNGRIANMNGIEEIILDEEDVVLGGGIKLFGEHKVQLDLELISTHNLCISTVQKHYRVRR